MPATAPAMIVRLLLRCVAALAVGLIGASVSAQTLAGGASHTVILHSDGTVWTVGANTRGQLGDNTAKTRRSPVQVGGLRDIVAVAAGANHTMALTRTGRLYMWGDNSRGQVGRGSSTRKTPVRSHLKDVVAIAAGARHSVALLSNGNAYTWGRNADGQLGNGSRKQSTSPVLAATGVAAVAAGFNHTIFVKGDGTVYAAGLNANGQLGDGTITRRTSPVRMDGITTATQAAGGQRFSVILLSDGTLVATGDNGYGQHGDGTVIQRTSPVPVSTLTNITAIAAGAGHVLALDSGNSVWAWGLNRNGQLGDGTTTDRSTPTELEMAFERNVASGFGRTDAVASTSPVTKIGAGRHHSIAVTLEGSVATWGRNTRSQLGDGTTVDRDSPTPISSANYDWKVSAPTFNVAAGVYSTEKTVRISTATTGATIRYSRNGNEPTESDPAIASGGRVRVTTSQTLSARAFKPGMSPSNTASAVYELQVAAPTATPAGGTYSSPQTVTLFASSPGSTIRYTTDGTAPTEASTAYAGPIVVGTSTTLNAAGFRPGWTTSVVMTANYTMHFGTLQAPTIAPAAGGYEGQVTVTLSSTQTGATIRYTTDGTTPTASSTIYTGPMVIGTTTTVTAMALHPDYTTSAEASSVYTITASPPTLSAPSGTYAPGSVVTISSPDSAATLRMTLDGTDPTGSSAVVPSGTSMLLGAFTLKVRAFRAGTLDSAVASRSYLLTAPLGPGALSGGGAHTVLVSTDGRVFAWGANANGQLGDGAAVNRTTAVLVHTLTGVVAVSAGQAHTLARTWDGQVHAWGSNESGQLGDGTSVQPTRPAHVTALTSIVSVAAGGRHSLALASDGRVFAWGSGSDGQLGLGSTDSQTVPTEVPGLSNVGAIAAGEAHSFAVTAGGQVYAWGANASSQLGDGTTISRTSPTMIGLSDVHMVAAGASHSLALLRGGTVYAWGLGSSGQLGLADTTTIATPTRVPGLTASAIAAGDDTSAAVRADGRLVAWGANALGQLGDTSTTNRASPTVVMGPPSVSTVALGAAHAMAVTPDGAVWTWGAGTSGQLGDGGASDRAMPQPVFAGLADWAPAAPVVSVPSGTFTAGFSVTVTTSPGAIVRYALTGADPTELDADVPIGGIVEIAESAQLRARVWVTGRLPGAIARADYTLQVAPPTITPATGSYPSAQTVAVTSTDAMASVRYTLDGTDPTLASALYAAPFAVDTAVTVTARAFRPGAWQPSEAVQVVLQIDALPTAPIASLAAGVYPDPVAIALSFLPDTTIRYTLDGSDPSVVSSLYVTPIPLISGTSVLKAVAFRADGTASEVLTATYTIDTVAPTITASLSAAASNGWHHSPVTVTFTCADDIGVASCTAPAVIDTEGAGLLVTGTAVDRAGRRTSTSVTVSVDLTPPTVALLSPVDFAVTSAGSVLLTASVADALSGIVEARCNGAVAPVDSGQVSCSVPLRPGRNAVVLTARDAAGHTTSAGVTVTSVGTVTRLTMTPATRTMLVSETGTLSLRDNFGVAVPSAAWRTTNAAIVSLSLDNPPVLTAMAPGEAYVYATKSGLTSTLARITVVAGTSLAEGTSQWTVAPLPVSNSSWYEAPIYPHRVDASGADVFMVETNVTTWERTLRAVTASGEVQWLMAAPGVPLMGDMFGGVVAGVEPATNTCRGVFNEVENCYKALVRFAGPAGTATWRYDSPGRIDRPAQGPDGTIYAIEHVSMLGPVYNKSVVILDGATGRVTARVPLANFVTDTTATNSQSNCPTSTHSETEPLTVGPIVAGDGFGYLLVSKRTRAVQYACGSGWVNGRFTSWQNVVADTMDVGLTLLRLSSSGAGIAHVIDARHCTSQCVEPRPMQLLPDGIGGMLVVADYPVPPNYFSEPRVTRLDGEGGRVDTPLALGTRIELIGQAGTAYLHTKNGPTSVAKPVVDVRTWTPLWSLPVGWNLLAASPEGGAVARNALGELARFNATGQLLGKTPLGLVNPVQEFGGWIGNSASGLKAVAGTFDDATRWDATTAPVFYSAPEQYGFGGQQRNLALRNPGRGVFVKSHDATFAELLAQHTSVRVTPTNQGWLLYDRPELIGGTDQFGNAYFTLGAGTATGDTSSSCIGVLTNGRNRSADVDLSNVSALVPLPLGQPGATAITPWDVEASVIVQLLATHSGYSNNLPYYCFPESAPAAYNSNSYVHGLLHAAGVPHSETPPKNPAPGWKTPVPAVYFQ